MALLLGSPPARADWPMARHDAKRTGLAQGESNLTAPAAYYRYYLGGSLGATQMLTCDVDGDGDADIVYASGGRVVAKTADDVLLWKTPPRGLSSFAGIDDLDGNGKADIVAYTSNAAVVLDAKTGAFAWVEPEGEMGALSAIGLGDLDGDKVPDLLIRESGCSGVKSGKTGFAYSFAKGFGSPKLLWTLPPLACGGGGPTLLDADGAPPLEVLQSGDLAFHLVDGKTGQVLATGPDQSPYNSMHLCQPAQIDGKPGDEAICLRSYIHSPAEHRQITAMKYTAGNPGALDVLWQEVFDNQQILDVSWVNPVADLDGNGSLEVVLSTKDKAEQWTTRIFAAADGAELGTISGQQIAGVAEIEEKGKQLLLTSSGAKLCAYAFDAKGNPKIQPRWSIADRAVLTDVSWQARPRHSLFTKLLTLDLDGDGVAELVTQTLSGPAELVAYKATGGSYLELAKHALPADVDVLAGWAVPPVDQPYPQLAVARNDGYLTLFDDKLAPSNAGPGRPGIRIDGYYAAGGWRDLQRTPVVASLDGSPQQAVVVRDSRTALLRLDAAEASLANPPKRVWQRTNAYAPTIVNSLEGSKPGIAAFGIKEPVTTPPDYAAYGLRADGSVLFQSKIEGWPVNDILPGRFNLDGQIDLVFQWRKSLVEPAHQTRAISGSGGSTIWNAPESGDQPPGLAVADFDGDGYDDVFLKEGDTLRVLSGKNGQQAYANVSDSSYFMATLYDVDGDKKDEVLLHGGYSPARLLSSDLQKELWVVSEDYRPYPYAAVAPCPSGPVMAEGCWQYPARLAIIPLTGPAAGKLSYRVLAGGKKYPDEIAAKADGKYTGQLTSATAHANLTGKGRPTVLVGSADGWLYGIDPCGGELDFAVDFGAAVGEAVFGDTDGDGRDEIIVTAADGYLYGLKNQALEPPQQVLDTDPDSGIIDQDVDEIVTEDKLSAAWLAAAGAADYEVAIVHGAKGIVSSPPWQKVGKVTSASVTGLGLEEDETYYFAVRARDGQGELSVDALSDGVKVKFPPPGQGGGGTGGEPAGGAGPGGSPSAGGAGGGAAAAAPGPAAESDGGCGCRVAGGARPGAAVWLLLVALLALGQRRAAVRRAVARRQVLATRPASLD